MKKALVGTLMVVLVIGALTTPAVAETDRGGAMGFIAGCCFGPRAAGDYNEGKELHWREWVRIVPFVNYVFMVIDGVEGYNGKTSAEMAAEYGAAYY